MVIQISFEMRGQEDLYFPTGGKIISHVWENFFPRVGKRDMSFDLHQTHVK